MGREEKIQQVQLVLSTIIDPETANNLMSSGKVANIELVDETDLIISLKSKSLRSAASEQLKQFCQLELCALEWVGKIDINFVVDSGSTTSQHQNTDIGVNMVKNIIAVSSGKGGVGKSTVAVNLAFALSQRGSKVGILDADIYGPSLPTMTRPVLNDNEMITQQGLNPLIFENVKLMSMGFINKGAAIMRGPMVNQILNQLVTLTRWGELDYLVLDLPPGTGDVQLTLSQIMNISAAVIVTTPQKLSFVDVVKGIDLFDTVNIPCIAVVENMAELDQSIPFETYQTAISNQLLESLLAADNVHLFSSILSQEDLRKKLQQVITSSLSKVSIPSNISNRLFGPGHNQRLHEMWGIENIISLPVDEELSRCSDQGIPYVLQHSSAITKKFQELANCIEDYLASPRRNEFTAANLAFDNANRMISILSTTNKELFSQHSSRQKISYKSVRNACRCAVCVEEFTGKKLLQEETIPENIKPINMAPIGRYAVSFDWSDGHKSLYPFKSLINLAKEEPKK